MLVNKPGSCFLDACELALGMPAHVIAAYIKLNFPEADCDNLGYHTSYVNVASLELFKIGMSQVDATPAGFDHKSGEPTNRDPSGAVAAHLSSWFSRPGFRCVITGPATYGHNGEHANAWNGQGWFDPVAPETVMQEPSIDIRSIWVTTVPPAPSTLTDVQTEEPAEEGEDSDPA